MTDGHLMDADCIHGKTWWECDECEALEAADLALCDHVGTGRQRKWDGGRCPLLCARCSIIVGTWEPDGPSM